MLPENNMVLKLYTVYCTVHKVLSICPGEVLPVVPRQCGAHRGTNKYAGKINREWHS